MIEDLTLTDWARAAAAGDRDAAERLLGELQGGLYHLALRMLGHPQDAEDATQEILVIVLTHLGSFRGESSLRTWCWRVASHHLLRVRRGRMETVTYESLSELLQAGLRADGPEAPDGETAQFEREVRLRCTEGMLLSLDRELRIAFILSEILNLSGEEAAEVLELDHATYRKRLSRARTRLLTFLRGQCGLFDPANPCRCRRQVGPARERGLLGEQDLPWANHPLAAGPHSIERCAVEVDGLLRAADVLRHPEYASPAGPLVRIRALLDSNVLELLRH